MAFDLLKVLEHLDVNVDQSSKPLVPVGIITWLGRLYNIHPDHVKFGFSEGMEVWVTGRGFAKLDLVGFETWLMDAPRGDHLLISEREISFDITKIHTRTDRNVVLWTREKLASFIGEAIIENRIQIFEEEEIEVSLDPAFIFEGTGPFAIKPQNDFQILEENNLKISQATPVLIPAIIHRVKGKIVGPDSVEIEKWVLNCQGLKVVDNIEILQRPPLLNKERLDIIENPKFAEVLSERKTHNEKMGELLYWWKFDEGSASIENFEVLIPGHVGYGPSGEKWILEGLSNTLHKNI